MFKHEFPEMETLAVPSKLHLWRRSQLEALARAYGVVVPDNATKNQLLPALTAAEESGVFTKPPKSKYWAMRAQMHPDLYRKWSSGQTAAFLEALDEAQAAEPVVKAIPAKLAHAEYGSFSWMQREIKRLGYKSFGMTAGKMREILIQHQVMKSEDSHEEQSQPHDESASGFQAVPGEPEQVVSTAPGG